MIKVILIVLICIILVVGLCNGFNWDEIKHEYTEMLIFEVFLSLLLSSLIIFVIVLSSRTSSTVITDKNISQTEPLVCMQFDKDIKGEHFLGSGSINNVDYIVFYTRENNEIKRHKIEAREVKKIISGTHNPHAIIKTKDKQTTSSTWFGVDNVKHEDTYEVELYIPEESIVENINLN